MMRVLRLVSVAAVALAAGCGGGSNATTPSIPCTLPAGTAVSVLYPIPGATGVPDSLSSVVLGVKPPLPSNWQIVLGSSTATYFGGSLVPGTPLPVPTPIATTPPGATVEYSTFVGTGGLVGNTVYQVALNNTNANCNSFPTFGSFTAR